jgi:hypothetical protein
MIGTFVTTKYDDRAAFERREASDILVSRNRFTLVGMEWMWNMMIGNLRSSDGTLTDQLASARLLVGNGDAPVAFTDDRLAGGETAQAELDAGFPGIARVATEEPDVPDAVEITFRATFGEDVGAFDWQERGVVTAQGVLLDRAVRDQGRKVLGAIWQLEARLRLDG